jgi:hypothetical protein
MQQAMRDLQLSICSQGVREKGFFCMFAGLLEGDAIPSEDRQSDMDGESVLL